MRVLGQPQRVAALLGPPRQQRLDDRGRRGRARGEEEAERAVRVRVVHGRRVALAHELHQRALRLVHHAPPPERALPHARQHRRLGHAARHAHRLGHAVHVLVGGQLGEAHGARVPADEAHGVGKGARVQRVAAGCAAAAAAAAAGTGTGTGGKTRGCACLAAATTDRGGGDGGGGGGVGRPEHKGVAAQFPPRLGGGGGGGRSCCRCSCCR